MGNTQAASIHSWHSLPLSSLGNLAHGDEFAWREGGERIVAVENSISMKRELAQLHLHQAVLDCLKANDGATYEVPDHSGNGSEDSPMQATTDLPALTAEASGANSIVPAVVGDASKCQHAVRWLSNGKLRLRIDCEFDPVDAPRRGGRGEES